VLPLVPATPALQTSDVSDWSGRSLPVHEKPNDEPPHVVMVESDEQPIEETEDAWIQQ
jgi:hypothetical protein